MAHHTTSLTKFKVCCSWTLIVNGSLGWLSDNLDLDRRGKNVYLTSTIASLEKIAKGTIKLGGGTAFYLGLVIRH